MNKQLQLIRLVMKCGKVGKTEKNTAVGDTGTLITLMIGIAAVVGMFLAGKYAAAHTATLGDVYTVFTTVMTASAIFAFLMTLMNGINQLYISSDLDVLITLPFTPLQIVVAKLVSVAVMPAAICFGLTVPAAIGYMTAASLPALFVPAILVGTLVLTVYVVSLTAILLMIIMRMFRFIRSRNFISVVTALLMFALMMAYMKFTMGENNLDEQQAVNIFLTISGIMSNTAVAFPSIGFTMKAAAGDVMGLVYAVAVGVAVLVVLAVCAKALYFKAALGMTDANGVRGPVSEKTMRKYTAKAGISKTLFRREVKQILQTPSLITNGYLYSIVVPFVMIGAIGIPVFNQIRENVAMKAGVSVVEMIRELIRTMKPDVSYFLIICVLFCLFMASMAVAFSSLSRFLISREGKDFATLKAMPVSATRLVLTKRNVVLVINGISGFFLPSVLIIVAGVLGFVPLWVCALSIIAAFAGLLTFVNLCALKDVKNPNLNWDNEAVVTKNNAFGVIFFLGMLAVMVGSGFLISEVTSKDLTLLSVQGYVTAALPVVAAAISELLLRKAAEKLY